MNYKKLAMLGVLGMLIFALHPIPVAQALPIERSIVQQENQNLLVNPGFEGIGKPMNNSGPNYDNWTRETFNGMSYGEIFTPEGWVTWWQEGEYKRPECKVIPNEHPFNADPKRVYSGYYAGMCFTFYGKQNAGYYQVVRNLPAGATVQASIYAHAWASSEDEPYSSGDPFSFGFQIGIDPNGGTDPFSGNIVWSGLAHHYDEFGLVGPVQATVGAEGVATVFTKAYAKWPLKHNDAYWDHASLVLLTPGETPTPTQPPPPPTPETPLETPTPRPTPMPRPDGARVHIVETGDTLFGIALEYDLTLDEILQLNPHIAKDDFLSIGQEIVVSVPEGGAAPQPTPIPTQASETPPTETEGEQQPTQEAPASDAGESEAAAPPAASAGNAAAICVAAFNDVNSDMFRQSDSEGLLPNAEISLVGTSGPAGTYRTDGISEPYCFQNLQPGNYILRHTPPAGYKLTDSGQWNIALGEGQVSSVELAYTRDENAGTVTETEGIDLSTSDPGTSPEVEGEASQEEEPREPRSITDIINWVVRISGFIVVALAAGVAFLFYIYRQRI
jgi:LysM repeat protein